MVARVVLVSVCALIASSCGGDSDAASDETGDGGATTTTTVTTSDGSDGDTTLTAVPETGAADEEESGLPPPPPPQGECFLWEDSCGEGRKCMPWSAEEDRIPDELRCCDEIDNPNQIGEPCEILEYDGSCLDTCVAGSMCLMDNEDERTGLCREFCLPGGDDCNSTHTCKAFFEVFESAPEVPVCMEKCDPLLQNCEQGSWSCIPDSPTTAGQSGFICVPPPSTNNPGEIFDACALANDCSPGLVCVTADRVPGCGFLTCCTAFCSLSDGDENCQDLHPDTLCVDWMAPEPRWSDVGACVIPD